MPTRRTVGFGRQTAQPRDDGQVDDGPRDADTSDRDTSDRDTSDRDTSDRDTSDRDTSDRGPRPAGFSPERAGTPTRRTADQGAPEPERSESAFSGSDLSGSDLSESALSESDLSGPWDDEIGSFGTWLRRQREFRRIDLRDIAAESRISMVNLRAFEEDRFDILPAPVFAKGFLRQYARYVGLDPEEVVNFYVSACRSAEGEQELVAPPPEARDGSSWKLGAVALLLTAVFALTIWVLTQWNDEPPPASPALPVVAEPAAVANVRGPEGGPATEPELGLAIPGSEPQGSATPSPGTPEVGLPDGDSPAGGMPEVGDPATLRVTLDFSAECWVEARVDGERQVAENKIQGESLLLEATERVEITIGNIDAVRVEVNGHPFDFDQVPGTKVRTQRIDLETAARLAGPEDEEG